MAYTELLYSVADGVATVTLHRPDKLNAFTNTMMRELHQVFDEIDADDNVRAVVMTGSGRGFCAGADLSGGRHIQRWFVEYRLAVEVSTRWWRNRNPANV